MSHKRLITPDLKIYIMSSLKFDDFLAFNRELTVLSKAGVPLPDSVRQFALTQNKKAVRYLSILADRLEQGASLDQAFSEKEAGIPEVYTALVRAGIRSNRLGELLDQLTNYLVQLKTNRTQLIAACLYPLAVFMLAYFLMIFAGLKYLENMQAFYLHSRMVFPWISLSILEIAQYMNAWSWVLPTFYIALILWWFITRSTPSHLMQGTWGPLRIIPGVALYQTYLQKARLCHMLSLMTAHQVPLPEAIDISTKSLGDKKLAVASLLLLQHLNSQVVSKSNYPLAYLEWIIKEGTAAGDLPQKLSTVADSYNNKAETLIIYIKNIYPYIFLLGLGVMIVVAYILMIMLPFTQLLDQLGSFE